MRGNLTMWTRIGLTLAAAMFSVMPGFSARVGASAPVLAVVYLGPGTGGLDTESGIPEGIAFDARTRQTFIAARGEYGTTGQITVLDTPSGRVLRRVQVDAGLDSIALDARRRHLFVATGLNNRPGATGAVRMLDPQTGRTLSRATVGPIPVSIALDATRGRLFVLTTDAHNRSRIATLDTRTGAVLRTVLLGTVWQPSAPQGVAFDAPHGRLFVVTINLPPPSANPLAPTGRVSVLDTRTGALLRTLMPPTGATAVAADGRTGRAFVTGTNGVIMLDADTGRPIRTIEAGVGAGAVHVDVRRGHVFVLMERQVTLLDARDGRLLHTTNLSGSPLLEMALAPVTGRVFVEAITGETEVVQVLDATTGALLGRPSLGAVGHDLSAVDPRTGRVFVTMSGPSQGDLITGPGQVSVLDPRTGAIRQRVTVGEEPQQVAVDPQSGVAIVVDRTDDTATVLAATVGRAASAPPARRRHTRHGRSTPQLPLTLKMIGSDIAVDAQTQRVFIATWSGGGPGQVNVLDARSGVMRRAVAIAAIPIALAVDVPLRRVYVINAHPADLAILDARSGALVQTTPMSGEPAGIAVDARTARVFVTNDQTNAVSVFDAHNGALLRTVHTGQAPQALGINPQTGRVFVANEQSNTVSVLDARSGALLGTVQVGQEPALVVSAPQLHRVFVVDADAVRVLDVRTGAVLRAFLGGTDKGVAVAGLTVDVARHQLIVLNAFTTDPSAKILNVTTGKLRASTNLDPQMQGVSPIYSPVVDAARGRIYVLITSLTSRDDMLAGPGNLDILDAATGALRRSVPLTDTVDPAGGGRARFHVLALDAATHRLFVLSDTAVTVFDTARL